MNKIKQFWLKMFRAEGGQGLVLVLVAMVLGSLVLGGLLTYASVSLRVSGTSMDLLWASYAADSGIATVMRDLLGGQDALSPSYTIPSLTLNNYNVAINISSPAPGTEPPAIYQYVDPGAGFGLSSLGSQSHYYFRIDKVKAGSSIRVNWAFTPVREPWQIKLYAGMGPVELLPPTIIAQDNFEGGDFKGGVGWLAGWDDSGDANVVGAGSPYEGDRHLRLRRSTGYVNRAVNLSGKTNVRLQFWAKAYAFEPGETATLLVSPNGTSWTVMRVWTDGEDDNIYRFEDIDLSSFSMTSQFWIAFKAQMSDTGDYLYVDDLKVVSQAVSSLVAEKSDTKGPGELLVDGSLISGGVYTLDFMNNSGVALVSAPFSSSGSPGNTWVYAQAYQDYLISSTAGQSTITVYLRQSPGSTDPRTGQKVYIESWKEP